MPPEYELDPKRLSVPVSDGTVTAWTAAEGSPPDSGALLMLGKAGANRPLVAQRTSSGQLLGPLAVAGPFVLWQEGTSTVILDTRTGATALLSLGDASAYTVAASGGGVPAISVDAVGGGAQLLIASIAALPELHC